MLVNSSLTVYHLDQLDTLTHLEKWKRYNYDSVWFFDRKSASINKGYENANGVEIRIPYGQNDELNVRNFSIGDIVVQGTLDVEIDTQEDLKDYSVYSITSVTNNTFGNSPHIHLRGE